MSGYQAKDIQVLEGLDAVRMRPGMYIGSTDSRGLHHLIWEIVDNAVDEATMGYADKVEVTITKNGECIVFDNGRGVPTDIHPTLGVSGVEVVYTQLHAGGKFDQSVYTYSGGLHGVGAAVVNALSEYLTVDVYQNFTHFRQEFHSYRDPETGKTHSGVPKGPLEKIGNTRKQGSRIMFKPDKSVFETVNFNGENIARRLREIAYLNRGLTIVFTDERIKEGEKSQTFCYKGGISDYVLYLNDQKDPLYDTPIMLEGSKDGVNVMCAIQYTDSYTESLFSYVNNIPTGEGGTHETGMKAALTKVLNDCARKIGTLKEKDNNLSGDDFREGITAVLVTQVKNPQFEGQTKGKLGNSEVRPIVEAVITEKLTAYLEDLKNANVAAAIVGKAVQAAKVREAARKAKDVARAKSSLETAALVGKLASCTGKTPEMNELFIVEGDSAGGSAKQGRDRRFQAILPLRGKPLNAEKKRIDQVLANEEFRSLITALGTGIERDFDIDSLKYHKVVILSDADQDGAHIRAILLAFFFRYMKPLIAQGHVYIGMPPLYKVSRGDKVIYAYDDKQLDSAIKKIGKGYSLQRYKGLGEMNPEQLWDTTLNPEGRTLMRVTLEDAAEADRLVTILLGDKVEPRKQYIARHADFNRVDDFDKRLSAQQKAE
ncbi:MAG: type IIA DNA topoisomerase subunit B [Clostridia bacterium]|nr:type IIA DNA topoisomerase subunit B [Clostridia bacterium]